METDVLSIRELAKKCKMLESYLKKIVLENKINHSLKKGKILVNVRAFDRWMATNLKNLSDSKLEKLELDEKSRVRKIHPMLSESRVLFNPPDLKKVKILKRLVDTLGSSGAAEEKDVKAIFQAVIEREKLCSTAISDGVAIPHPRSSQASWIKEDPALVLAISPRGIDFESDDGKATHLFFLICANNTDVHLKVMARLSRLLRSPKFRHELVTAEDFQTVLAVFKNWEKKLKLG